MELVVVVLNKIFVMFIILVIGIICFKTKVIDEVGNKKITNLVLMLVSAIVIFMSYQVEFDKKLLLGLLFTFLISSVTYFMAIVFAHLVVRKTNENYAVERMSLIYSNCGFMGIPLVGAVIGEIGVFYLAVYITIFNILIWTHGYIQMTGKCNKGELLKILRSPCIIAVFLGIICFLFQIKIPSQFAEAFNIIAATNTPLAMLCAGAAIANANILGALKRFRTYLICFLKLLVIPIITVFIVSFLLVDENIKLTIIVATACPTGAVCTQFALKFNKNASYASEIFGISTALCVVTIPIVIMVAQLF